jgi:hypothetical protein
MDRRSGTQRCCGLSRDSGRTATQQQLKRCWLVEHSFLPTPAISTVARDRSEIGTLVRYPYTGQFSLRRIIKLEVSFATLLWTMPQFGKDGVRIVEYRCDQWEIVGVVEETNFARKMDLRAPDAMFNNSARDIAAIQTADKFLC